MGNMKLLTIVNGIEDVVEVELLCAFESKKLKNKYIIYTKNEKDLNKNTIIYAGKIVENADKQYLMNISDGQEWEHIKEIMKYLAKYADNQNNSKDDGNE